MLFLLTFKFLQRVSCIFLVGNFLVFFLLELLYSMSFCLSFTCLVMGYFFMGWRHLEKACCDGKIKLLVTHKSFSPFKFLQRVSCFFSCWKFSCIVLVGIIVFNVLLFKFYLFCDGIHCGNPTSWITFRCNELKLFWEQLRSHVFCIVHR